MSGIDFLHHYVVERVHISVVCRYGEPFANWALKCIKKMYGNAGAEVRFVSICFCASASSPSWHALTGADSVIQKSFQQVPEPGVQVAQQTQTGMWLNVNGMPFILPTRKKYPNWVLQKKKAVRPIAIFDSADRDRDGALSMTELKYILYILYIILYIS